MVIKTTRWSPDTCQCILEYNWDDTQPESTRQHTLARVVQACSAHRGGTESTVFNTVLEENPRKNFSMKEILDNAPTSMFDIEPESGQRVFKKGVTVDFTWSGVAPNRLLTLTIRGVTLTNTQRNTIQSRLDTRFGVGKATVVQG